MSGIFKTDFGVYNTQQNGEKIVPEQLQHSLSKSMSYHLRHDSAIDFTSQGWMSLEGLRQLLDDNFTESISIEMIEGIVELSGKQRYEIHPQENRIRALYGHSIDSISVDSSKCTPDSTPNTLFHGTPIGNRDSIESEGIQPQSRNTVHLTSEFDTAVETAYRHTDADESVIVYKINTNDFLMEFSLYNPSGDTYTAKEVPPEFLRVVEN